MNQKFYRFLAKNILPFDYKGKSYSLMAFLNDAILDKYLGIAILWNADEEMYYLDYGWGIRERS